MTPRTEKFPVLAVLKNGITTTILLAGTALAIPANAAEILETFSFGGKDFVIQEADEGEKVLEWGGLEVARNWYVSSGGVYEVQGKEVAVFYSGDGGNACGPKTILATVDEAGRLDTESPPGDCGDPMPAISEDAIYFVPWLRPGESEPVYSWSPYEGIVTAGIMIYTPQEGTGWKEAAEGDTGHPTDFLSYEELYDAAAEMLGEDLAYYALGLSVASEPEKTPDGLLVGSGCIPHSCGSGNSLIVVDTANQKLYLAQQDGDGYSAWPDIGQWPQNAKDQLGKIER